MASTPTPPSITPSPEQAALDDARQKYETLFDSLTDAYYAALLVADKKNIQTQKDAVYTILSGITHAQLDMDTTQLKTLTGVVETTNDALEDLQTRIASIVSDIGVVGEVESAISGVLSLAGKFL
jgi:hypothetical protein